MKLSHSFALQVIFSFCDQRKLLSWQSLMHRYYDEFLYGLINTVTLYINKGLCLKSHKACIKVFNEGEWVDVLLNDGSDNQAFYSDKTTQISPTCSKLIQVNRTDVYVIGGSPYYPSLLQY